MEEVIKRSWPEHLPQELVYKAGEKPLHEYLKDHAEQRPMETSYIYYGREISWKELYNQVNRLATYLIKSGVEKGSHVALYMQNSPQYIISHFAIQRIGAIVVPLNPMNKESELIYLFSQVDIKGIIVGDELYPRIQNIKDEIKPISLIITTNYADYLPDKEYITLPIPEELKVPKQSYSGTYDLVDVIKNEEPFEGKVDIDIWKDIGLLMFTSGTTGRPKAAMLTYGNALFKTAATVAVKEYDESTITTAIPPLFHIAGMVMGVNIPIYSGCKIVLFTRFDPEAAITAVEKYKVTSWYTIAPMNVAVLNYPGIENRDLSSLERNDATSFGIPVTEQLAKQWSELTGGCTLSEASYGLSETHTADTFMPDNNIKYGSCGIPTYETELRIVDMESGRDLHVGEQGEIVLRNPGVFKGYLNHPEDTAETLRDGWVFTGDVGTIDEDGHLYFLGRTKEMIKVSGFSVFPEDVEELMKENEAILQIAIVGIPDNVHGEIVKAFIVLNEKYKGKVTEQDIIEWSRENIAEYKCPREVEFRDELPVTSAGKVLRRLLKEE